MQVESNTAPHSYFVCILSTLIISISCISVPPAHTIQQFVQDPRALARLQIPQPLFAHLCIINSSTERPVSQPCQATRRCSLWHANALSIVCHHAPLLPATRRVNGAIWKHFCGKDDFGSWKLPTQTHARFDWKMVTLVNYLQNVHMMLQGLRSSRFLTQVVTSS